MRGLAGRGYAMSSLLALLLSVVLVTPQHSGSLSGDARAEPVRTGLSANAVHDSAESSGEESGRWAAYRWGPNTNAEPLSARVPPPPEFARVDLPDDSFAKWLRGLPTRPGRPAVHLHDGRLKGNQGAHHLVIDIDTGPRDLQQCADAVMRLRAEWLLSSGRENQICFRFTNGEPARWTSWRDGERARIGGSGGQGGDQVIWTRSARPDSSYGSFRQYLDLVFAYAGSWSLSREARFVEDPQDARPGDMLIRGGFPGHAVLVLDLVEHPDGRRAVLLGQSFMPAQDFHLLKAPGSSLDPWYLVESRGEVRTPEWLFDWEDLMRLSDEACPPHR